jgi:hypothetical protein
MWSASDNSLKGYETKLGSFIQSKSAPALADVAFHSVNQDLFNHRSFTIKQNAADAKNY